MSQKLDCAAFVGVDWGDQEHAFCILPTDGGPAVDGVLEHRAVADFDDVLHVGFVAAGTRLGEAHVAHPAGDFGELLGGDIGVGRPLLDAMVREEAVYLCRVGGLFADEINRGLADNRDALFEQLMAIGHRVLSFDGSPNRERLPEGRRPPAHLIEACRAPQKVGSPAAGLVWARPCLLIQATNVA